jgi:hypothetical protein
MTDQAELEREAASGSPEAQYALARELLSGAQSDSHLQRAIQLVELASNGGYAPASELCAVFEAMGVARPQDWNRALDCLVRAALQGSDSARRQLLILSRTDAPQQPDDWAAVRASVSMDRLLGHGERRALCDAPRIRVIEGFASAAECAWLIERSRERLEPAVVLDATGAQRPDPVRTNSGAQFPVHDMDIVTEVIRARISAATRLPLPLFEPSQVLHYSPGEEFRPHHDYLDADNPALRFGQRIATFLFYLNEQFEGGATEFPLLNLSYSGTTGDAIFFANVDSNGWPDPDTLHAGRAPTAGEKWILSQWIRDRLPQTG